MNNQQLNRLIQTLARGRGGKSRGRVLVLIVAVIGYALLQPVIESRFGVSLPSLIGSQTSVEPRVNTTTSAGEQAVLDAFAARRSDVIVEVDVVVKKNLPDDNIGSRHQKMILELPSGHTVLLAHNIDLAKRVPAEEGDRIRVKGEYEYSEQGGVLHWTHHDPGGRHVGGWIEHDGQRYE